MRRFLVLAALATIACNDRTIADPPIFVASTDMGVDLIADVGPEPDLGPTSPQCDDKFDGEGCNIPNGAGICADGRCRFVACLSGFANCDGVVASGCETDVSSETDCGACGEACEPSQSCQAGSKGLTCATRPVCAPGTYDVDLQPGCEWESEFSAGAPLVPPTLELPVASRQAGGWWIAGIDGDARVVTTWPTPSPFALAEPAGGAEPREVFNTGGGVISVWSDGIAKHSGVDEFFTRLSCEEPVVPREFFGAADDPVELFAVTNYEVVEVDLRCTVDCEPARNFGQAEYLQAFYPYIAATPAVPDLIADARWSFDDAEVMSCDPCLLDQMTAELAVDPGCFGPEQCRPAGFDESSCAGCGAMSCPEFAPRDVALAASGRLYVATSRGLVVLDVAFRPLARLERAFDPMSSGGTDFVAVTVASDGATDRVTLVDATGAVISFEVDDLDVTSAAAQVGFEFDPVAAKFASAPSIVAAAHDDGAFLIAASPRSGRVLELDLAGAPGISGLVPRWVHGEDDGIQILYEASGQVYERTLTRIED